MRSLRLLRGPFRVYASDSLSAHICPPSHAFEALKYEPFEAPLLPVTLNPYPVRIVSEHRVGPVSGRGFLNGGTGRSRFSTRKGTRNARCEVKERAKEKPMRHMQDRGCRQSTSRVKSDISHGYTQEGHSDSVECEGILEHHVDFDFQTVEKQLSSVVRRLESKLDQLEISRPLVDTFEGIPVHISGGTRRLGDLGQVVPRGSSVARITLFNESSMSKVASALRKFDESWSITEEGSHCIRVQLPKMTEEVRERFVTEAKALAEECKVDIRRVRQSVRNKLHSFWQRSKSVDETTRRQNEQYLQQLTDKAVAQCSALLSTKLKKLSTHLA